MKHHYVYYSYEEWGRGYVGSRSCFCLSEQDTKYFGSYTDTAFLPTEKIVIATFKSRKEALFAEMELHKFYNVDVNPHFANKSRLTSEKFIMYFTQSMREELSRKAKENNIKPPICMGSKNGQHKLRTWKHEKFGIKTCSISELKREFKFMSLTDTSLSKVALGRRSHHKGWSLVHK